ncbi:glycosyltransferase family 4 protein [Candidatus Blastococcus massiliensis]|uniref:glycosyltransferase family 4 protein n=1 Tax=Candidatus Blastococcus massiliensis TaxID=1470358 RepID=UPI0004B27817|nr:glycosyltransferase family 1 protein [Candidatus Blastococcus massiliensis]
MTSSSVVPPPVTTRDLVGALRQRLEVAAATLGVEVDVSGADSRTAASLLYAALVERVHEDSGTESLWLLLTAVAAAMPDSDEVLAARRARDLHRSGDFGAWLLDATYETAAHRGALAAEMAVVEDTVVVDVDFTAQHKLHTGIQRVVRETVPRWHRDNDLTLAAWTTQGGAMRWLEETESDRVLRWHDLVDPDDEDDTEERDQRLLVPWRSSILLPENPPPEHCPALAALAVHSGNRVALIGHDCIPVISPELIHTGLPDRFTRYLEVVKHAERVAGVSASAAREFRGFTQMLAAQGLTGPDVAVCPEPSEIPSGQPAPQLDPPLVVSIGSFEPRKNQLAVLHAAEHLWREGLRFQLRFIGGGGWVTEADGFLQRLRAAGRPVTRATAVTDAELWHSLRSARFSLFTSLHEGFGLPVAESLACGTPVITTHYGSTAEIAAQGGALTADPTDDLDIADRMRQLLTDDVLLARLRDEAAARPRRTWDDYARESWAVLVPSADDPAGAPA